MSSRRTISNTFTVTTMDDPVSVQAQYSPDKTVVHTVWQAGDLYMRTRESDSSAWSSWHKIVGESGDETDFSFGISQYKTTANVTTAPSDITTWSDAPLAVTSSKPYLWAKVQKKSWNESTQQYQVDSTSYIRLTGEDGYTVQAQYAPNNNPTSSQIHTTWQDGDLYMRTKQSNETTWSSWHRIVGEGGDETDYTFAISQYKTTSSATTAPSDISSSDWQDAPLAVTSSKPYLWSRVQKKVWNDALQDYVVDSTRYIRLTGEEGEEGKGYKATVYRDNFTLGEWNTYGTIGHVESWGNTESSRNGCGVGDLFLVVGKATDDSSYHKLTYRCDNSSGNLHGTCVEHQVTNDGKDGTSPYFADLNNEMDAIQCKHDGGVITAQTVSTVISMWKGSAVEAFVIDKIYRNGTQLTWGSTSNGVKPSKSGSTVSIEFGTNASIADIDDFKITIYSYNDNTVTRELHFTINGVRANAIYRLVPSNSQIVKKKDGTYVPSGNVTCSVEKTENGSTSTPSSSEYTLEKSVNGGSYTTYSATAASSITSDLKFRLTVGGVVVDLETIPLVSDGNKGDTGDSAPAAFASPAQISIPCYSNGNVKAQKITSVIFSLKVGTNTATVTSCSAGTKPTGVTVQGQANNSVTITVGTSATASGLSAGVTFTVTGTYDGKTYSATVTVALIGSTQGEKGDQGSAGGTGPRGKIGRFFYYAGEFDSSNATQTFVVNDAQAPYFSHGVNASTGLMNCHVYNPTVNGTFTMAQMWANSGQSWNNEPWEVMTNDFMYLITKAIFGSYAHFGACVINGDWLISIHGKIDGTVYAGTIDNPDKYNNTPAYTFFDPIFPLGANVSDNVLPKTAAVTNLHKTAVGVYSDLSVDYEKINDELYMLRAGSYRFKARMRVNNANYGGFLRLFKDDMVQNYAISTSSTTETVIRSGLNNVTAGEYYFTALTLYNNTFEGYTQVYQITNSRNSTLVDYYNNKRYVPIHCKANSMPNPPSSLDPNNLDGGWSRYSPQGTGSNTYVVFGIIPLANYTSNPQLIINDIEFEIPEGENGRFVPNYAVDLRRGRSYQNDAFLRGQISTMNSMVVVKEDNQTIGSGWINVTDRGLFCRNDKDNPLGINEVIASIGVHKTYNGSYAYENGTIELRNRQKGSYNYSYASISGTGLAFAMHEMDSGGTDQITSQTNVSYEYVRTDEVKTNRVNGMTSSTYGLLPVAFPANVDINSTVTLPANPERGMVIFAPNCKNVKASHYVYMSNSSTQRYEDSISSSGHEFNVQSPRIFVGFYYSGTFRWKEYDCA